MNSFRYVDEIVLKQHHLLPGDLFKTECITHYASSLKFYHIFTKRNRSSLLTTVQKQSQREQPNGPPEASHGAAHPGPASGVSQFTPALIKSALSVSKSVCALYADSGVVLRFPVHQEEVCHAAHVRHTIPAECSLFHTLIYVFMFVSFFPGQRT